MKVPHIEGVANHDGPEPCVDTREGGDEASVGVHTGRVLSREISLLQDADAVIRGGRQHGNHRQREVIVGPARSETPRTCENFLRENREIPRLPIADGKMGRFGKVNDQEPNANDRGKSDESVVPTKRLNETNGLAEEIAEGRDSAKGNMIEQNASRTQSRIGAQSELERVRQAAKRDRKQRFTALFHHFTVARLHNAFLALERKAAAGIDGVTWQQYRMDLEENLQDLHGRLHRGAYRAKPSRRVYIPKSDGRQRPLGIAALEDKIVQRAAVEVLNAVYETDFLGYSYGFRPGRNQHQALDALAVAILRRKVNWVLDADIRAYFDTINHEWLVKFLEHRIADPRMLRLIRKWLKAGILENGQWQGMEEGTPQGATISPLLANVYLHYAFDLWIQQWRSRHASGEVIVVRYADDFIVGFQREFDATRFREELKRRLEKFALELHPEKTRLLRFGRFAAKDRQAAGEGRPETFDFLGFTHICEKNKTGCFVLVRRTSAKRMRTRLKELRVALNRRRHLPIPEQGKWIGSVLRGYFTYHAIPTNIGRLCRFRTETIRYWRRALVQRSQCGRMDWTRMKRLADQWLPPARILHPWPEDRFDARTQGRSRVR